MEKRNRLHYAWFILAAVCIIVGLGKSVINSSGSLFLDPVSKDLGIGMGDLTLYLSIGSVVTLLILPFIGKIFGKYDARLVIAIAIVLQAGCFAAFGFMDSVWGWYILAIPMAFGGVPIMVICGPVLINRWFKKSSGMALGIMGATGGLIGAIATPIIGSLIANAGWRQTYTWVGLVVIAIVVPIALLVIRSNPQNKGLKRYGEDEGSGTQTTQVELVGMTLASAKKTPAFMLLLLFFFMITAVSCFAIHIPSYLQNNGYTVEFAGVAMSGYSIGLLVGSLGFGYLTDKIGAKIATIIAMSCGLASIVLLLLFTNVTAIVIFAVSIFGFISASIATLAPAVTGALFGNKEYSQIYSSASLGLAVASIAALPAYGYILDFTGSYKPALITVIALLVLTIICIIFAFRSKEKLVSAGQWK